MGSGADGAPTVSRARGVLRVVVLDVVAPLVVFQVARAAGASQVVALVLSAAPPALGVAADWVRWRVLDVVGSVVLAGLLATLLLALVSDDPRVVLLEGAGVTATVGVAFLVTIGRRRPLLFHFAQAFYGGPHSVAGRGLDSDYATFAEVRRLFRHLSVVWGVAHLVEAALRVGVVLLAPTQVALLANRTLPWVLYVGLLWWSTSQARRLEAERPDPSRP